MSTKRKFDRLKNQDKFFKMQKKRLDRIAEPDTKGKLDFSIVLTNKEILKIQSKGRILKAKYGLTRAKVLREVLLNLDDEDLICFLGLYNPDKVKK
ncbi:hypothetical protein [Halarcobacter ebronensis]|uniref:Uncharacterized protein n=1 Tax=Halarcobacter ebronensis TaxID=1462615 RepID=A0A4Q1AJ85_9BACT|nr:hypothetical protein [Halarcobacter ebronensis]QKF82061.1 hypothetical protein AEBR_1578 [Halarcobacter ebronensis]RXK04107.1 hypothetical protein CRV07_11815 [Halarcobacter ebronensis]